MTFTLPEIKNYLKKVNTVKKITIDIQEFGEGFDSCVNVWYIDKFLNDNFYNYQIGEEETRSKAINRAKRATESLEKIYDCVENVGVFGGELV